VLDGIIVLIALVCERKTGKFIWEQETRKPAENKGEEKNEQTKIERAT